MLKIITDDLLSITKGILCHQVNCQNAYGKGLALSLALKYPVTKQAYHKQCQSTPKSQLLGTIQKIPITTDLMVCNLFSQFYYGNAFVTKKCYTDIPILIQSIQTVCHTHPEQSVYIPYGIGCGLGGASWNVITEELEHLKLHNLIVIKLPETSKRR